MFRKAIGGGTQLASEPGEHAEVLFGAAKGSETANKLDAQVVSNLFRFAHLDGPDLGGGTDVRPAASATIEALDFDDSQHAGASAWFAEVFGGISVFKNDIYGARFGHDAIGAFFDRIDLRFAEVFCFELNGRDAGAQVKAERGDVEELDEDSREQVLAGVLLHVIVAAGPVDGTAD